MGLTEWPVDEKKPAMEDKSNALTSGFRLTNLFPSSSSSSSSIKKRTRNSKSVSEKGNRGWFMTACEISKAIDEMSVWIRKKRVAFVSLDMPDDEASLIQSTVTSFAATTANEIESLRQWNQQQQQQLKRNSNSSQQQLQHETGIVQILVGKLKEEIAEPFSRLQKQRQRMAVRLWQNPMQCPLLVYSNSNHDDNNRALGSAAVSVDPDDDPDNSNDQRFLPKRDTHRLHQDFLLAYTTTTLNNENEQGDANVLPQRPESILFRNKRPSTAAAEASSDADSLLLSTAPSKRFKQSPQNLPQLKNNNNNNRATIPTAIQPPLEHYMEQDELENEAVLLTATLQQGDLDSVRKIEEMMVNITTLLSQFSNLVAEQQDDVVDIRQATAAAKENVQHGQEQLLKAKESTQQSKHYVASGIFVLSLLLLVFHWIAP